MEERRYVIYIMYTSTVDKQEIERYSKEIITGIIEEQKGKVIFNKILGQKNLAYKIKKQETAELIQLYFLLPDTRELGTFLKEINRKLNLDPKVLRFLLLKSKHKEIFSEKIKNYQYSSQ